MKIYRVLIKKVDENDRDAPFWEDLTFLIISPNFSTAEDKAQKLIPNRGYIHSITSYGQLLERDHDVIKIKER